MATNPYARVGASQSPSGSNPYARIGSSRGNVKAKKKERGGFLGTLSRIPGDFLRGAENAALEAPAALATIGHAAYHDSVGGAIIDAARGKKHGKSELVPIAKDTAEGLKGVVDHPLRDPFSTVTVALPAVGAAARVGLATKGAAAAAKAGESAGTVAKTLVKKPDLGPRVVKVGDMEARGHYSRASGSALIQKGADALLQKSEGATGRIGRKVEKRLEARAGKWNDRHQRVADAKARVAGTRLSAAGAKLSDAEKYALKIVAREVPIGRRLGAQEMRMARATHPKEIARHQERIDLNKAAAEFLTDGPDGKPTFKPESAKLARVYDLAVTASGERGDVLKALDLMDEVSQQAAKLKLARIDAGGHYVKSTPGRLGIPSKALKARRQRIVSLQGRLDRLAPGNPKRRAALRGALAIAHEELATAEKAAASRVKPTGVVGADDITVSAGAPFIPNPVRRNRITGKAKVNGPAATIGHTRVDGSLKESTGGSVVHANERNDITGIVAERHAETARLASIDRLVKSVKRAGRKTPTYANGQIRKDMVWVWTDKTVSNERIDKTVREYLDDPESIATRPEKEQQSVMDRIREASLERHDWLDEGKRAEFEEYAEKGKGVFVPRKVLGAAGKWHPNIAGAPGMKAIDTVNNAQKAALVYLKANYLVIQAMSNTAMNIVQQGFVYPGNSAKAFKTYRAVGPEITAVVDDIMGQGAVLQAAFEGQGAVSHMTQRIAHVMSSKIDRPARLSAFHYEAHKMGYDTPEKFKGLIEDDANINDLVEAAQRGKEAIVDYGEMSPAERSIARKALFVYPWLRGSTKYAGHFFRDHPLQAAALAQLGEMGADINDKKLGPRPSYMKGVFDVGGGLVNPAGVNPLQTPAQIGRTIAGYMPGGPDAAPSGSEFASPALGLALALLTKRDEIGRPLERSQALQKLFVDGVPAIDALRAAAGHGRTSKTFPNQDDAMWRFLLGGLYPRDYDKRVLNKNAARQHSGR